METIPISNCTKIGYLQKPRGIHGEFLFSFEEKYIDTIESKSTFFLKIEGILVPFFIAENGLRIKSAQSAFVNFKWINSDEKAREFAGSQVYLKTDDIIIDEIYNEFTPKMLKGFIAYDPEGNKIGQILNVDDYSGNVVLTIDFKGEEILIPFNEGLVSKLDEELKTLFIEIPQGLLEDYQS